MTAAVRRDAVRQWPRCLSIIECFRRRMSEPVRRRVLVEGRVQGVNYRATCARAASAAGVSGWVRNLSDGRVEAVFEGDVEAVNRLVGWCGEGPPHARVDRVDTVEEPPTGDLGFRVA